MAQRGGLSEQPALAEGDSEPAERRELFEPGWARSVPAEHYAGSALAWSFYAQRARAPGDPAIYAFLSADAPEAAPAGAALVASDGELALYALDAAEWKAHQSWLPAGSSWQKVYDVPRDILFERERAFERYDILDAKGLLSRKDAR